MDETVFLSLSIFWNNLHTNIHSSQLNYATDIEHLWVLDYLPVIFLLFDSEKINSADIPFYCTKATWIWKESQFWTLLQFSSILNTSKQNHLSISPFLAALLFKTLSSNFPMTTSHVKLRNNDFFEIIPAGFYVCGPLSSLFVGFTSANISNSTMHPNLGLF